MTEFKLLALLAKVEKNQINIDEVINLKDFTDEEIDLILPTKHKREVIKLIRNKDFRSQQIETQKKIIEIIDNYESNEDSLYWATEIAQDKIAINSGYITEIVEIIIGLKEIEKIYRIINIAKNPIATSNKDMLKIIQMIAESEKSKDILIYVQFTITNKYIYRTGTTLEIVKSILNAQNEKEARTIFSDESTKAMEMNLLDALDEEKIDEVNFWDLLLENYEIAAKLLLLSTLKKSIIEQAQIVEPNEYDELMNKYILEDVEELLQDSKKFTEQLSSNIRVRRK